MKYQLEDVLSIDTVDLKTIWTHLSGNKDYPKPEHARRTNRKYLAESIFNLYGGSELDSAMFDLGYDAEEITESGEIEPISDEVLDFETIYAEAEKAAEARLDQLLNEHELKHVVRRAELDEMREKLLAEVAQTTPAIDADAVNALVEAKLKKLPIATEIHVKVKNRKVRTVKGVLPDEFEEVVELATADIPFLIVGPTGSGKSYIGKKLAEVLGYDFSYLPCSAGMTESKLSGMLAPVGAGGKFEYVPVPFVTAYEKGNHLFLAEEIDASDPNVLLFLNTAIAGDELHIPQRHKNPVVKRHTAFRIGACANTWGHGADMQYVGRNPLDAATLDRFAAGKVFIDYSDKVEESIIDSEVLEWGRRIREGIRRHGMERVMSTRTMVNFTKLKIEHGAGRDKWEKRYFCDWSEDDRAIVF